MLMIRGSSRTPDRLLELFGSRVQQSKVFRTTIGAHGPYNLGGFATHISHFTRIFPTRPISKNVRPTPRI
jgi:hypothetical protein